MIPLWTTAISPPESMGCRFSAAGGGEEWLSVFRGRRAVRSPARVRDPGQRGLVLHPRSEVADAGHGAHEADGAVAQHGDATGIIAAVLQPPQPLDQGGHDVPARRRADNSAHGYPFFFVGGFQPGSETWRARESVS